MLSRWKLMAGILGVSLGGLAAAASQCPKWDRSKGRTEESAAVKADPKASPAGAPSTPAPLVPVTPDVPAIPAAPSLTPAGPTSPAPITLTPPATVDLPKSTPLPMGPLPSLPEVTPAAAKLPDVPPAPNGLPTLPATPVVPLTPTPSAAIPATKPSELPAPPAVDTAKKPVATPPAPPVPSTPPSGDLLPPPGLPGTPNSPPLKLKPPTQPTLPTEFAPEPMKSDTGTIPLPTPEVSPMKPATMQPVIGASGMQQVVPPTPPVAAPPAPKPTPPAVVANDPLVLPVETPQLPHIDRPTPPLPGKPMTDAPPAPTPVQASVADSKFRIVLRVGEGEPTFEVKNGDNLMLKVACEKVDIKSPEKGGGLSEVTARGKVRFVGFGAEGTCDELKFMAGTGEVSMSGEVKVQVKDKLGRVESELTSGSLKYKLDSSSVGGQLKP